VTTQTIEIKVNGNYRQVAAALTVESLLLELGIRGDRVAVELDKQIVPKREWSSRAVPAGGELEIVEFVGGG
jgi:sulfur carrier protein